MQRDDEIRLRHMLDAAREAVSFAHARVRTDLETDRQLLLSRTSKLLAKPPPRCRSPRNLR